MELRPFLEALEKDGDLVRVTRTVDPDLEIAAVVHALGERPVLFEDVAGSDFPVFAGIAGQRDLYARALGCAPDDLTDVLRAALNAPRPFAADQRVDPADAPCMEHAVEGDAVDVGRLPLLKHFPGDAGRYATASIVVVDDPDHGPNASFHRLLPVGKDRFTGRFVEHRGTDGAWRRSDDPVPCAVLFGSAVHVLLAAAISPAPGVDEMTIANALEPTPMVETDNGLWVPAATEIVLEGRLLKETHDEGPFVDLTETQDIVRQQAVLQVDRITHRTGARYQALLSGGREHKLLMGMPREVTIRDEVARVCDVVDACLTRGGGSWLHAVVKIRKRDEADPARAIEAAFKGHTSLKSVVVVDPDIDIYDPVEVEWALATRFQADRDLHVLEDEPSSSLDPSARHVPGEKSRTTKTGLDATIPLDADPMHFEKLHYEDVDLDDYVE